MNLKKIAASLTAMTCLSGALSYMPELTWKSYAAEVVCNDFEANYDGWYESADNVVLTAEHLIGNNNSRGMKVTGRKLASDGASSSKGLYLVGGVSYEYSLYVFSEHDETFNLSILVKDETTDKATVKKLVSKKVNGGEWTKLTANYKAPENSYDFTLTLNTDSTNDFVFDDVKVTTKKYQNSVSAASTEKGLKDEFANYFRVGNILNGGTVKNSNITANIIKNYNSIECENETKPDATLVQSQSSNSNIGVTLSSAAAIFDFCVNNNIGVRGHTLVWHSQTPSWFFKDNFQNNGNWVDKNTMDARLESYIKNMFNAIETQYPDLDLYAYDVCNECISDDSNRTANYGGARVAGDNKVYNDGSSAWVSVYGDNSFVEKAFRYAKEYAPDGCSLFYNDYNEYWDHKRDCIYNMCKDLYNKGLLDGVGMQSHINANMDGFSGINAYKTAMQKYASIGCQVQVTELDISIEGGTYSLQQQAEKYKAVFQAAMDTENVTAVCIWGPNDANTWIKTENAPLLFDTNNQPKAAYTALTSMIPESQWGDGSNVGKTTEPDENGYFFHSTFEGTTDNWAIRGSGDILTSGRTAYKGKEALLIENRKSAWNGATRSLSARTFVPGNTYSFSTDVMYFDGGATDNFFMKLQYIDGNGTTQYSTVAEGTAVKGEWIQLKNTNYTIPSDATDMQLYVETAETTNNFYIDEAIGAVAGTDVEGPVSKKIILGDTNYDGRITSIDLVNARKWLLSSSIGSTDKIVADVDQSGKYELNDLVLLSQFILGEISEFPVAEKQIDVTADEQIFKSLSLSDSYKKDGENNPLYTQRFGADPGFMVYKDRLYVYTTNDAFEYDSNGKMKENSYDVGTINCCSSSDLVNWTDHGAIQVAGRNGRTTNGCASWASCSWAPDACWKTINGKDKFFLYFANSGGGIGVLTADSPTGPWTDPLGHALVTGQTPNCSDVVWMFDPAVLVDDDGTGYLYFGGGVPDGKAANPGTGRCVKLGDDMISLAGTPVKMDTPYLFEDSSILKIGDTYYYSYCTNWSTGGNNIGIANAQIAYMTSKNPLGPFTFQGVMFKNTAESGLDKGGNNHHSLVYFKNNYYLLYHTRVVENRMGINLNYRSPSISAATFSNGKISVNGTHTGVSQLETLNPYTTVQAETMSNQSKNIRVNGLGNTTVSADKGEWIKASGVNFSNGENSLTIKASSKSGSVIKVCTGSPSGTAITYVEIPAGSSQEITVPVVNEVTGQKDVYFVFSGQAEMDYWVFS